MSSTGPESDEDPAALLRQLQRERRARVEAEAIADSRLRELFELNRTLDQRVADRTSELATMLEVAGAASQAKRSFLAHVGHALETPMHAVLGNLELIDAAALEGDDATRIGLVRDAAEQLSDVIEGLLLLAASTGRPFDPVLERRSPSEFLEQLETRWFRKLAARGQLLVTETDGADEPIVADWARLHQIADILLANVRAHAQRGRVSATLHQHGGLLTFSVTDSGPGIPAEHLVDVTAPFFRLDRDPGSNKAGVGIGLAIAVRLVESVGGGLQIVSDQAATKANVVMPIERRQRPRPAP